MSLSQIVTLIDEEISRLQQARALLAESVALARMPRQKRPKKSAPPVEPIAITVVAPRVLRERVTRVKPSQEAKALSATVPTGAVAVSATEAAKNRQRQDPPPPVSAARWLSGGSAKNPTIDDLFRETGESSSTAETKNVNGTGRAAG